VVVDRFKCLIVGILVTVAYNILVLVFICIKFSSESSSEEFSRKLDKTKLLC